MPSAPQPPLRRRGHAAPTVLPVFAALYVAGLAVILLSPDHLDQHADLLFRLAFRLFPSANGREVDFALNVLVFLPFGVLLAPLLRRRPWTVLVIAWAVPTLIEAAQGLFLPGRVSSVYDVVANTAGSLTAALFVAGMRCRLAR
ncbi:VanZ family protein [Microbacterium enclense]|uniref:VanZ family protein n=1 Tax=Microbacterium enclense TaxID=993073 RepID=UPI0009EAD270|nr:VanZ family protein [Microbacterium enclense]